MRSFLIAVQFLTRLPVPGNERGVERQELRRAAAFFPLVGTLIGLITAGVIWGASLLWPVALAVLLGLAVEALLTGAFHEDAVADFFDAFGGGWTREDVLRIMKDSRNGSFGTMALVLALLLRATALSHLSGEMLFIAVAVSAGLGRLVSVLFMVMMPAVSERQGLARDVGQVGLRELLLGSLWCVPGAVAWAVVLPQQGLLAVLFLALLAVVFYRVLHRRLGGTTGDCLGCICYLSQVLILLAATARNPLP